MNADQPTDNSNQYLTESPQVSPAKNNMLLVLYPIAIILLLIIIAIMASIIYWQFATAPAPIVSTQPTLSTTESLVTPTSSPVNQVNELPEPVFTNYVSDELGFSFELPSSMQELNKVQDTVNQIITFGQDPNLPSQFTVRVQSRNEADPEKYYYLDTEKSDQISVNGNITNQYISQTGYCDGPNQCTPPYIAYVVFSPNQLYILTFVGDTEISQSEQMILDSFEVLIPIE